MEHDESLNAAWLHGTLSEEQIAQLTPEQQERYQNQVVYNKEHKGHEAQHELMAFILLFALFASQFLILYWKKKHYKSYQAISLGGLYFFPVIFGIYGGWYRFLITWILFSLLNGYVIYKASRQPLEAMTPRLVYKWYTVVYNASFVIGLVGYIIILGVFFGFAALFSAGPSVMQVGLLMLCYGLYFGVLGRDFVEICTDRMAATIGYYSKDGLPNKYLGEGICAVCGYATSVAPGMIEKPMFEDDPVHQLTCKHVFHEKCIRGWVLVGKKDICPYCKEKVDLKEFKRNPWDTQQQLYLSLLDGVRYLVVWQPIIFAAVQLFYYMFGLD
ncbi:hypothetical protein G6F46_010858 [Rhizopus delemar]|uniref:RING-type domain-containing protein n=2 Tax=Rhizopus TaxID=4842 RepID=A0A9P7CK22_9FUNG|nr:hypothetical protein G6F43_009550 [Rhizopus delemar]KAG1536424.1 hypothetical protein G6F51_010980 [Rhizopus arrhizus]KAG1449343.1 hypothetical protein G6F55_010209 [Rhizopus delemar]KAG1490801.1 hypothetical protein G6F54_010462 [Rhizopus delemar]KAG1503109.1 hypothetical protein G6F53_010705 [Rhizopus delemar]